MFDTNKLKKNQEFLDFYLNELLSVRVDDPYFSTFHDLHYEFTASIHDVMKKNHTLYRNEELLEDYEMFIEDMRRKYRIDSDYGYPLRSHHDKVKGIPFPDYELKIQTVLKDKKDAFEFGGF